MKEGRKEATYIRVPQVVASERMHKALPFEGGGIEEEGEEPRKAEQPARKERQKGHQKREEGGKKNEVDIRRGQPLRGREGQEGHGGVQRRGLDG